MVRVHISQIKIGLVSGSCGLRQWESNFRNCQQFQLADGQVIVNENAKLM
jgi:hypothetical protein